MDTRVSKTIVLFREEEMQIKADITNPMAEPKTERKHPIISIIFKKKVQIIFLTIIKV